MTDQKTDKARPGHPFAIFVADMALRAPRYSPMRPLQSGMKWQAKRCGGKYFRLPGSDGITLDAVLFLPKGEPADYRWPIVYAHGYVETKEVHLREALLFAGHGHPVLLYDQRAHGRSRARHMTFSTREQDDLSAVLDYVSKQEWGGDHIITAGFSLGSAVVIQLAARDARIKAVIALAPFADANRVLASYQRKWAFRWQSHDFWLRGFHHAAGRAGFSLDDISPLRAIGKMSQPCFIAVGDRDSLFPARDHAEILAEAAGDQCEYHLVKGANHPTLCVKHWPELDEALLAFLDRVSKANDAS